MKKLFVFSAIMIFAVAHFTGCQQDPNSSSSTMSMKAPPPPPPNSVPAWVFRGNSLQTKKGVQYDYPTVAVSNSDGTNICNVYTSATNTVTGGTDITSATWSADGKSASFIESYNGTTTIKSVDISVVGGVATGSNVKSIISPAGVTIKGQAWCPATGSTSIAYIGKAAGGYGVYTTTTSGTTPVLVYQVTGATEALDYITWSPDGTKIACWYGGSIGITSTNHEIRIIDATTGALLAQLAGSTYYNMGGLVWSNTGLDNLAYSASTVSPGSSTSDFNIYTIATTAGSTPTQQCTGRNPFWSPDNLTLVYEEVTPIANQNDTKEITLSSGAKTTVGSYISYGDWK